MSNQIAEKLAAALSEKENDVTRFVWKGKKLKNPDGSYSQEEVRLLDASEAMLQRFYNHAMSMLYNTDRKALGRCHVLRLIQDQRNRCGVELFFRYYEKDGAATRHSIYQSIKKVLENENFTEADINNMALSNAVNTEPEFEDLPLCNILEGGVGKLGIFDRTHITLTFILREGVWLNENEYSNIMAVKPEDMSIKDYIRQTYRIPDVIRITLNPKGLSLSELKAMLSLASKKYIELTDEQLTVLRNRILFSLEEDVKNHIKQWEKKIEQIKLAAQELGYTGIKW